MSDTVGARIEDVAIHVIYDIQGLATIDSVELVSFAAQPGDGEVTLLWTTACETDNDHFNINRDGTLIAQVRGHGTTSIPHSYTYLDENVQNNRMYYYVLISVDISGEQCELASDSALPSGADTAWVPVECELYQNYPNPVEDTTCIHYTLIHQTPIQLTLGLVNETPVTLVSGVCVAGSHVREVDMTGMANGLYECRMIAGNFLGRRAIIKSTGDNDLLHSTSPGATTADNGAYSLNVAYGDSIEVRDDWNRDCGKVFLQRVTIVALKAGYEPADTTLDLTEHDHRGIDFTLHPE